MPNVTARPADARLELVNSWLREELAIGVDRIAPASADASFRRYFRVHSGARSLIVMDAPPEREDLTPFVEVAAALGAIGVNVPRVLEADRTRGFLLLTDLGSTHYLAALGAGADTERLYADATETLLAMQTRGHAAAARLAHYGTALLGRELAQFPEWFLVRHLGLELDDERRALLEAVSATLMAAALEQPQVFVHRDFHSRNLMLTPRHNPGVLDFQDAVRGAITYDPVSLWKDCYIVWPRERVLGWLRRYRRRAAEAGLAAGASEAEFVRWFDLMGVQRHLKVLGVFARLWYRDGKPGYLGDLPTVLNYVLEASADYAELAALERFLRASVLPAFASAQARVRA
jgi:aminoglycoside/choline kinase family phosphotransferase